MLILKSPTWLAEVPWLSIFRQMISMPEQLPSQLKTRGLDAKALSSLLVTNKSDFEPYSRNIIFRNDGIEVMLASWAENAISSPHNHGFSSGLIWFVEGDFAEQHFNFTGGDLVKQGAIQKYKENSVVTVRQSDIHSCGPSSFGVSLHIYSPPIHGMKVWDTIGKRTLTVADECGAWIPKDENLILDQKEW